jgi:hypothetical protein
MCPPHTICYNPWQMSEQTPLIVAFVDDLLFTTKITNTVRHLGYRLEVIEDARRIGPFDPAAPANQAAEPVLGQVAHLLERLTEWQPALLIFDLDSKKIPWQQWLPVVKSSPATRRLPALCFGPHVEVATLERARSLGADVVIGRSRFTSAMAELIQKHARVPDRAGIAAACDQPLSELAIKGLESFNRGAYFEAHEELEEAWNADASPAKELYRAVLQIAVAYLQIERGNYAGAVKMFLRARQWFEPLPDRCRGIDVARLRATAATVHRRLLELGPERIGELERSLFQPVHYTIS